MLQNRIYVRSVVSHDHYCGVTADGKTVHCMHVPSNRPTAIGGWIHKLDGDYKPPPPKPKVEKPVELKDFCDLACKYQEQLIRIDLLAEKYGVSERSLERLNVGWNGFETWPMRVDEEHVVGIRLCDKNGKKWCVDGSMNALFWPEGVHIEGDGYLFFPEGGSDTAAALTWEFQAIGRFSNSGGVAMIRSALKRKRRDTIIPADNDKPKIRPDGSVWFPGREGAEALAKAIRPLVKSCKIIQPPKHKDIRQWLNAGATRDTVMAVIDNTEPWL